MKSHKPNVVQTVTAMIDSAHAAEAHRKLSRELVDALKRLFTFFGEPLDDGRAADYARPLGGLSGPLLAAVIEHAIDTRTFFPKPVELRQDVDLIRRRCCEQHPHQPCSRCEHSLGWVTVRSAKPPVKRLLLRDGKPVLENGEPVLEDVRSQDSLERCKCYIEWENSLRAVGALSYAPTSHRLPAAVMTSVGALAERLRSGLRVVNERD